MRFEWDEDKNRRNLAKHKVSSETASLVFDDPQVLSIQDRVVEGEERWQTVGVVSGTVLFVAHTYRDEAGDEVIRLISARKAITLERRAYAKSQKRSSGRNPCAQADERPRNRYHRHSAGARLEQSSCRQVLSADQEAPHDPVGRGRSCLAQRTRQGLSDANQRPFAKFDGEGQLK